MLLQSTSPQVELDPSALLLSFLATVALTFRDRAHSRLASASGAIAIRAPRLHSLGGRLPRSSYCPVLPADLSPRATGSA